MPMSESPVNPTSSSDRQAWFPPWVVIANTEMDGEPYIATHWFETRREAHAYADRAGVSPNTVVAIYVRESETGGSE